MAVLSKRTTKMKSKRYFFEEKAIKANRARHERNKENGDRFIPVRADALEGDINHAKLLANELNPSKSQDGFGALGTRDQNVLSQGLYGASHDYIHTAPILGFSLGHPNAAAVQFKKIPHTFERTSHLDAPELIDDYYFDSICWGTFLYIGLGDKLYTYNPANYKAMKIDSASTPNSLICSLAYNNQSLARASDDRTLQILDLNSYKQTARYATIAPCRQIRSNQQSGFFAIHASSRLAHYDLRAATPSIYFAHRHPKLTGLAFNEKTLSLAVNSESTLRLFDIRNLYQPIWSVDCDGAFGKAIAFSPNNDRLVTGGGTSNTTIQLWRTSSGFNIHSVRTGGQVCGLHWLDEETIVSNHGFFESQSPFQVENAAACWGVKNNVIEFDAITGKQEGRLLYSAQNPQDKSKFAIGSANEMVSIWSLKNPNPKAKPEEQPSALTMPVLR